jgi:hypothetical protein
MLVSTLTAIGLIGATSAGFAQNAGIAPGMGGVPPIGAPANPATAGTSTTGTNTGISQPGAPNTSTPGIIGTGASPSGLPGDDPQHPGFPARVGND